MRILFVSSSPIKKELSIGNTFLNLFEDMDDVQLASICTRNGAPDLNISKCFCITEKMIIKNILKGTAVGKEIESSGLESTNAEEKTTRIAKKYRFTVFFWIQDLIWKVGRWKSKQLEDFVKDFDPDIIFTVLSNSVYLNNLILHIKKISGKKLVLYAWDNNYSLKIFMLSPFRWIKHFIDRASMRRTAKKADVFYVISNVQKADYEKAFKRECKLLTKVADFSGEPPIKLEYNSPIQLVYTGNIKLNRWRSLTHIANVLEQINKDGVKAELRIYTGNQITEEMSAALNRGESSFIMGSVSADKVAEIQENADMLVHVEALNIKSKLTVRQSFSTKIVDYLAASRPILAFGPKDVASIDHFIKNDCAIVADNEEELLEKLSKVISNKDNLDELARKAYACGRKNHNKKDIDKMLREDFYSLI